jgi:NAD dependent epimerase/dehydratase family enzyme
MADIVVEGSNISATKIMATGYTYKFRSLDNALSDLLR